MKSILIDDYLIFFCMGCRGEVEETSNPLCSSRFFQFIRDSADPYISEDEDDDQSTEDEDNSDMDAWEQIMIDLFFNKFPV